MLTHAAPRLHTPSIGPRAQAMGNSYVALSRDFSGVFWNPAGLAFVTTRSLHFALEGIEDNARVKLKETATFDSRQRLHIQSAGLLRAVPTSRGGLSFALGYSSPWILDDLYSFKGRDTYRYIDEEASLDTLIEIRIEGTGNYTFGQLNLLSGAAGWQIAPDLGFGFTLSLLTGSEDRRKDFLSYHADEKWQDSEQLIRRTYLGYDLRAGLLYTPQEYLSAGVRLDMPRRVRYNEEFEDYNEILSDTSYRTSGSLRSGFSGAAGVAGIMPLMTWSLQLDFKSPLPEADENSPLADWRLGGGAGVEVPIPGTRMLLRGGYSWHELDLFPMTDPGEDRRDYPRITSITDEHQITAGLGVLLGETAAFEMAYLQKRWKFRSKEPLWSTATTERHRMHRFAASITVQY
jgi:hypothetical protein